MVREMAGVAPTAPSPEGHTKQMFVNVREHIGVVALSVDGRTAHLTVEEADTFADQILRISARVKTQSAPQ